MSKKWRRMEKYKPKPKKAYVYDSEITYKDAPKAKFIYKDHEGNILPVRFLCECIEIIEKDAKMSDETR